MTWQFLVALSILLFALTGLFHRVLMKHEASDARAQTVAFLTLGGIFSLVIAVFRGGVHIPDLASLLPNFGILLVLSTIAPTLTFQAFKLIEASEVGIVMTSQRLWTVLAAFVLLQEQASILKVIGTLLILLGVSIALWRKSKFKLNRGVVYVLLAAMMYGLGDINVFYILRSFDPISLSVYGTFLPVFALLFVQPRTVKKLTYYFQPKHALNISVVAFIDTLATLALYYAYQIGRNAAQIAPLMATETIVAVLLAALILHEKENLLNKIIGSVVAVLGVVLVI